jgi:hypothetical protein
MDERDDLLLRYLQQFALLPSPPRQDEFKTHAEVNQPTYSPPGRSRRPASVPPIPGIALVSVRGTKAPPYEVAAFYLCRSMMLGFFQTAEY